MDDGAALAAEFAAATLHVEQAQQEVIRAAERRTLIARRLWEGRTVREAARLVGLSGERLRQIARGHRG